MNDPLIDTRRLFRNRFERYIDRGDSTASAAIDGSPLTLQDLCALLADDIETFPAIYDQDMRQLCSHEYMHWFRKLRTYGDVTRVVTTLLASEKTGLGRPGGLWLREILKPH